MLSSWPPGTVVGLATTGENGVHAIPVSAALVAGPHTILLALAASRGSLARLRVAPGVAVLVLAAGDLAYTARGVATVVDQELAEGVAGVRVEVAEVDDHRRPTFAIEAGVVWRWTDIAAESRDAAVRQALVRLARRVGG
jgi:hypothetical protein